jgi:hypothetical protein
MNALKHVFGLVAYGAFITIVFIICSDYQEISDMLNPRTSNKTCGRFPTEERILIDNLYWQVLENYGSSLSILNAYLDLRQNKSVVRLNVNSQVLNSYEAFYCQFWFDGSKRPKIVQSNEVVLMWSELKFGELW